MYARTKLELLDQLRRSRYAEAELRLIDQAYEATATMYAGLVTATGRTQVAHVVGTASILDSVGAAPAVVAASLLHNVYQNGDFRDGVSAASSERRRRVCATVGPATEIYVWRFAAMKRLAYTSTPLDRDTVAAFDAPDRAALLIVVADCLEHRRNREDAGPSGWRLAECAEHLALPALAAELRAALSMRSLDRDATA